MPAADRGELTPEAQERITSVVKSLAEDRVDRGVDLSRPMHCDSCDVEKSPLGSSQYGAYALCNDCLLEFTLALAKGGVENVAEYMTRRPDGDPPDQLPANTDSTLDVRSSRQPSLPRRGDKLMPSNEPC